MSLKSVVFHILIVISLSISLANAQVKTQEKPRYVSFETLIFYIIILFLWLPTLKGKSLLELWVTTFLPESGP